MENSRRDFLKCVGAAYTLMLAGQFVSNAYAAEKAISLEQCMSMSPIDMAKQSPMVENGWVYLNEQIVSLEDEGIVALVSQIYSNARPMLDDRLEPAARRTVWKELQAQGYTAQAYEDFLPAVWPGVEDKNPFVSAPGSGYGSHHAYPGGLVTHTATNAMITDSIVKTYKDVYGYNVNRDIALAAQLLHDLHKPWVFQWLADGSSRTEQPLAGAGQHHVLTGAELIVRKAPAELVIATLCAHTHPGTREDEAQIVGWIKAAAIIAGVDPVKYGLLDKSGETLPQPRRQEGFLCHLGDHDFVLSVPAVQWTLPVMSEIARQDYKLSDADLKGKPFNSLRNRVYSQASAMRVHNVYAHEGREGVRKLMLALVVPGN